MPNPTEAMAKVMFELTKGAMTEYEVEDRIESGELHRLELKYDVQVGVPSELLAFFEDVLSGEVLFTGPKAVALYERARTLHGRLEAMYFRSWEEEKPR